jgi:hypothetical protein
MGAWLHGYLADYSLNEYSQHTFLMEAFPRLMNDFLKENER